jgi:hypothetical protein
MRGTDVSANQFIPIELNCEDLSMVWGGQSLVYIEWSLPSGAAAGVATGNGASVTSNGASVTATAGSNGYALAFIIGSPIASQG